MVWIVGRFAVISVTSAMDVAAARIRRTSYVVIPYINKNRDISDCAFRIDPFSFPAAENIIYASRTFCQGNGYITNGFGFAADCVSTSLDRNIGLRQNFTDGLRGILSNCSKKSVVCTCLSITDDRESSK